MSLCNAPIMALTATASSETQSFIVSSLSMSEIKSLNVSSPLHQTNEFQYQLPTSQKFWFNKKFALVLQLIGDVILHRKLYVIINMG